MIRKIAITGPESTGKSLLAEQLAHHYNTVWVPEYAREYLENIKHPYEETDILKIAQGQLNAEQSKINQARDFLFCDTELIVTKIWSEVKYNHCDPWILTTIDTHRYDLFLLCDIDLPWEPDPLREHPEKREFLFDLYYKELIRRKLPFDIVNGEGKVRVTNAITFIQRHFLLNY
jgi:NadR type nicotinamide-nucleotide adenylyltransferase